MADLAPLPGRSLDEPALAALQAQAFHDRRICVVGALIANPEGQIFVQQRVLHGHFLPGCWDIVGGHVEAGETLIAALAREIQEETGWQLQQVTRLVGMYDWESIGIDSPVLKREFDFLAVVHGDLDKPQIESEKVMAYQWIGRTQVDLVQENRQPTDRFMIDLLTDAFRYLPEAPL
ncbi:MAG TPA: NUDIX domain-containing protein [Anaerolineales bacterium]|nr:NUDIX domain-containing protein [Anaerolineales bacterium]